MATTKKPSAAQLAARKRFAEMARAGVFTKGKKRKANPAKKRAPAKPVTRASQATGKRPSKRLMARRVKTAKAPAGFFANPAPVYRFPWLVETEVAGKWGTRAAFASKPKAVEYAQALADANDKTVRVRKAGK